MRLTTEQRVKVTVNPITAGGRPAVIDGKVSFTSSDTAVANIQDHESDLNSAYVVAVGEGAAQITATFDARMGTEVREVTASGSVEIVSPEAERGEIVFGTPEQL